MIERSIATADLVLLAVAVPMVLATLVGAASQLGWATALGAGSLPASGSIGYALFCDPPETTDA